MKTIASLDRTTKLDSELKMEKAFTSIAAADQHIPERNEFRRSALAQFKSIGLPTRKSEAWRYTALPQDFSKFFSTESNLPASKETIQKLLTNNLALDMANSYLIVCYNGLICAALSNFSPAEITFNVNNLAKLWQQAKTWEQLPTAIKDYYRNQKLKELTASNAFIALNQAFTTDGNVLAIPENTVIAKPIILLHLNNSQATPAMATTHNYIQLADNAKAKVLEVYLQLGDKPAFTNAATKIDLAANSELEYYALQQTVSAKTFVNSTNDVTDIAQENSTPQLAHNLQLHNITAEQKANSKLKLHNFATGGGINRCEANIKLIEPGANCNFNAIECPQGNETHDLHLHIEHLTPNCSSNTAVRGIVSDTARAVFTGKITVHPGATQTAADLQHKHLLLSPHAEVDSRPQLEIYNDDVKCSHGSAIGQLDQESLFYMQARGIPEAVAKTLLINGFTSPLIAEISIASLRQLVGKLVTGANI